MPQNKQFIEKLLDRLDKVDKQSVQNYLKDILDANGALSEIMDRLGEGVMFVDLEGNVQIINDKALAWITAKEGSSAELLNIYELAETPMTQFMKICLNTPDAYHVEDFHLHNPRELFIRVYGSLLNYASSKGVLFILEDRTSEGQEHMAAARNARIESLIRLAAGVAHEIGNPLNSFSIHLQLLKSSIEKEDGAHKESMLKTLDVLNSEMSRMDRIIKTFLQATRKPPLRFLVVDLNQLIQEVVDLMLPDFKTQKINVNFEQDSDIPAFLMDKDRMTQVFVNLIKNALEAMPEGGNMMISVSHEGKSAAVRVDDSGTGISKQNLPKIFDAYFTTKKEGSGLGLMTVFNAVTEHGGHIDVESTPNKGSSFQISLPIRTTKLQLPTMDISQKGKKAS